MTPEELAIRKAARAWERRSKKWHDHSIDHSSFGRLVWANTWTGNLDVPLFAESGQLLVELFPEPDFLDNEPPPSPGEWATKLWMDFCSAWPASRKDEAIDILHACLPEIAKPWLEHMDQEDYDDYGHDIVAHIKSRERFVETLSLESVGIVINEQYQWVEMWFNTEFDPEHGLQLGYVTGKNELKAAFGGDFYPDD